MNGARGSDPPPAKDSYVSKPKQTDPGADLVSYYLQRAEEAETLAELMQDPTAKTSLLQQSQGWKRMADQAAAKSQHQG